MRPGLLVPEECCIVETSADGKRTFVYEKGAEGKRGRLLAVALIIIPPKPEYVTR
jgi:hypothetical protein